MEVTDNEQIEKEAQGADALKTGAVTNEISLGKFKDVNSLLNAYNSLQAEFTRRCQLVKELEGTVKKGQSEEKAPFAAVEAENGKQKDITDDDKKDIIRDYLKELLGSKQKAVILGSEGASAVAVSPKPKTIAEAGRLAKEILSK